MLGFLNVYKPSYMYPLGSPGWLGATLREEDESAHAAHAAASQTASSSCSTPTYAYSGSLGTVASVPAKPKSEEEIKKDNEEACFMGGVFLGIPASFLIWAIRDEFTAAAMGTLATMAVYKTTTSLNLKKGYRFAVTALSVAGTGIATYLIAGNNLAEGTFVSQLWDNRSAIGIGLGIAAATYPFVRNKIVKNLGWKDAAKAVFSAPFKKANNQANLNSIVDGATAVAPQRSSSAPFRNGFISGVVLTATILLGTTLLGNYFDDTPDTQTSTIRAQMVSFWSPVFRRAPIKSVTQFPTYEKMQPFIINENDATKAFNIVIQKRAGTFTPEELKRIEDGLHISEVGTMLRQHDSEVAANGFSEAASRFGLSFGNFETSFYMCSPNEDATFQLEDDIARFIPNGWRTSALQDSRTSCNIINGTRYGIGRHGCTAFDAGPGK